MKAMGVLVIAVFFILVWGGKKVNGQTVAIGHVFAEVVESVSAASATISDFEFTKSTPVKDNDPLTTEMLNLGAITLNSGKNITCNIVLSAASLKDKEGNSFTIDPVVKKQLLGAAGKSAGLQTIQLGANTNIGSNQASGLYEGSYTVIFAYN